MTISAAVEYTALIPAKPPHIGKQRLSAVPPAFRSALATAFALDTIAAVRACPVVREAWLVCSDPALGAAAARLGVPTVEDPEPASGDFNELLRTVVAGLQLAADAAILVVPADLPALTPADLEETLRPWDGLRPAFVADARGRGTTLYVGRAGDFDPCYGPDSREAHLAAGASELPAWLASVQQDVDDARDLDAAIGLGVGNQTRAVMTRLGLGR